MDAKQLEQVILGEWVRALPCGCVMQIDEMFELEGWFHTDSALFPCDLHPKKRFPLGMRICGMQSIGDAPYEVLGPMEGRWFDAHGCHLKGYSLEKAEQRSQHMHTKGDVYDGWRCWDGNTHR